MGTRRLSNCLATLVLILGGASAGAQEFYQNPVIPGDHPDPSIIRVGGDYWATSTSSEWGPQFPLLHSTDLVNWEMTGSVFAHRPDWAVGNFWAPEISEYKGSYQVYYVGRKRGGPLAVAVATADKPSGPYIDHGPIVAQDDGSIDPVPFTDQDGARYLIWKEDGNSRRQPTPIWAQRLNEDGTKLVDQPHELIRNDAGWEGGVVEGPYVLRRGEWLYLFYSGNGCCGSGCNYALGVARAHTLFGPWEKNPANPLLADNDVWKCPGHGSIVADEQGRYWLLYHAYSTGGSIFTGREGMLDEVKFGANGWPTIDGGSGPSARAVSPFGVPQRKFDANYSDDFRGEALRLGWQWPQQSEPVYHLDGGHLSLSPRGSSTNFLAAVLARSTTVADYTAMAVVETENLKPGWLAGLCAFGDSENAMGLAVSAEKILAWRRDRGTMKRLAEEDRAGNGKIFLRLTARHGYRFQLSMSTDGEKWTSIGETSEAKNMPPWDRSVRVALTAGGGAGATGIFDSLNIQPLDKDK